MEELNALETFASSVTVSPKLIGLSKEILLIDAVTTCLKQCLRAATDAIISTHDINIPPNKLLWKLVSLGKTICVETAKEFCAVLGCIT